MTDHNQQHCSKCGERAKKVEAIHWLEDRGTLWAVCKDCAETRFGCALDPAEPEEK